MRIKQILLSIFFLVLFFQCKNKGFEKFDFKEEHFYSQIEKKPDRYIITILISWDLVFENVEFTDKEKSIMLDRTDAMFMTIGRINEYARLTSIQQTVGFSKYLDKRLLKYLKTQEMQNTLNNKIHKVIRQSNFDLEGHILTCLIAISNIENEKSSN
jgi:hypothetical protein